MSKLDKAKPYGEVHGDTEGRAYIQDGVYYNSEGEECKAPAAGAATAQNTAPAVGDRPDMPRPDETKPDEDAVKSSSIGMTYEGNENTLSRPKHK